MVPMGTLFPETESHLESIVYFLSESLAAAIEAGDQLQHSICDRPHIEPGMDCSEIAGQLARFRHCMQELWEREMFMLTKILRANDLARELRSYEHELKPEIDTFRLTSIMANNLRNMLMPDAETVFNGSIEPKRFLESRGHVFKEGRRRNEALHGYKVAGEVDVRLLLDACETLHYSLAARYGFDRSLMEHTGVNIPSAPELMNSGDQETLLLSDFGEILSDPLATQLNEWNNRPMAQRYPN